MKAEAPEDRLLDAAVAYLEEKGAKLAVIGDITVQHQPDARRLNHELVIKFTGVLPDHSESPA